MNALLDFLVKHEEAFRSPARLASLYSDFQSQKTTNPDGYSANCAAWVAGLTAAGEAGLLPSSKNRRSHFLLHTDDELLKNLQHPKFGRPLALNCVVDYATKTAQMIDLDVYMRQSSFDQQTLDLSPRKLITYLLRTAGLTASKHGSLGGTTLVVKKLLEVSSQKISDELAQKSTSKLSRIFTKEMFDREICSSIGYGSLSDDDFRLLATYLSNYLRIASFSSQYNIIKFPSSTDRSPIPVTDEDREIANFRALLHDMEDSVTTLDGKIADLNAKIRQALAGKNSTAAKNHLRTRKLAESNLNQRSVQLHQLQEAWSKLEQAADQVEIVHAMEAAGRVLRGLNEKTGGVEHINEVMDELRENIATTDEIGQALNEDTGAFIDEGEIDDELEALQAEEAAKSKTQTQKSTKQEEEEKAEREAEQTRLRLAELDLLEQPESISTERQNDGEQRPERATA